MLQLSIVIPAYNAGCWIEQLIESLAEQQGNYFEEFEIIITDDGSTDNTVKVVEKSKQKYATLQLTLLRQRNLGVSAARNYGIEQAKGRFCWFVDADDMIAPYAMNNLIPLLRDFDGDVVKMGACVDGCLKKNVLVRIPCDETNLSVGILADGRKLLEGDSFGHTTFLWSREVIVKYRLRYPENIQNNEDYLFVIRFLCVCGKAYINFSLRYYFYRDHDNSLSRGNYRDFRFIDHKLRNQMLVFELLCHDRLLITDPQLLLSFDSAFSIRRMSVVNELINTKQPYWCVRYFLSRLKATGQYPFKPQNINPLTRLACQYVWMLMILSRLFSIPGFVDLGRMLYKHK